MIENIFSAKPQKKRKHDSYFAQTERDPFVKKTLCEEPHSCCGN